MFRVMIFNDRLKKWEPTAWGTPHGATKEECQAFKGLHTFRDGVIALRDACTQYRGERYRLVHQK